MAKQYQDELEDKMIKKSDEMINSLPDFAKKYFRALRNKNKSERTIQQYATDMKLFFEWLQEQAGFKNKNINTLTASEIFDELTIDDINEYTQTYEIIETETKKGKVSKHMSSPSYRARRASSLRSFINYYFVLGETTTKLAKIIEVPELKEKEIVAMNEDDVARLLAAVKDTTGLNKRNIEVHKQVESRDYALLVLGLGTGLRVSEIIGIDIDDIDFKEAKITVVRKGGDQDHVYFNQDVEDALLDYKNNCRDILIKNNKKEHAFFVNSNGTRLTTRYVEMLTLKYAKRAGLSDKITPHVLRKSFGTLLYRESGDIYMVKDALHHSNIQTTVKYYAKQSDENKRKAADLAANIFKK